MAKLEFISKGREVGIPLHSVLYEDADREPDDPLKRLWENVERELDRCKDRRKSPRPQPLPPPAD